MDKTVEIERPDVTAPVACEYGYDDMIEALACALASMCVSHGVEWYMARAWWQVRDRLTITHGTTPVCRVPLTREGVAMALAYVSCLRHELAYTPS